jgi:long-chain acyl-CoA synthetase
MTLGELLHMRTIGNPEGTVLYCEDQTMSWEELDQSTTRLAGWFLDQGLQAGDRVAIHWSNRIASVQLFFGLWKAGVIAVPVNSRLKPAEISYILAHSQARMCFSEPALAPLAAEAGAERLFSVLPSLGSSDVALPEIDPDQPAAFMYTSGTTARPKGVTHTHRTLINTGELVASAANLDSCDTTLVMTPIMHLSGLACSLSAIVTSGSAVLLPAFQPAAVLDTVERFGCACTGGVPAMMHAIAEEQSRKPRNMGSLATFFAFGDRVPVSLQERVQDLLGVAPQVVYGLTECGVLTLNWKNESRHGSLGAAAAGAQLRIVDSNDRDVPAGDTGEIVARSPLTCIGYWNDAPATEALLRNGWLHTGDLASRDSDGYYWFKGRKKEIIIRGGSNISPQEVEEALYPHPLVMEVGVIGMPDPVLGERVIAFVSLRTADAVSEKELIEFARQRLADYKTPERVLFVPQLPRGLTGKVQRRVLKEMLIAQPDRLEKGEEARM